MTTLQPKDIHMADETISIDDPRDQALLRIAQASLMNATTLPSGFLTPARDLIVDGTTLRTPTAAEARSFAERLPKKRRPY
jgi:hypothetical protein